MMYKFNWILKRIHNTTKFKTKTNMKDQEMSQPTGLKDITYSYKNTLMNPDILSHLRKINYLTVFANVSVLEWFRNFSLL